VSRDDRRRARAVRSAAHDDSLWPWHGITPAACRPASKAQNSARPWLSGEVRTKKRNAPQVRNKPGLDGACLSPASWREGSEASQQRRWACRARDRAIPCKVGDGHGQDHRVGQDREPLRDGAEDPMRRPGGHWGLAYGAAVGVAGPAWRAGGARPRSAGAGDTGRHGGDRLRSGPNLHRGLSPRLQ